MYRTRGGFFSQMPPVTKNLIIINVLIWLVEVIFPRFGANAIIRHLGLHYISASEFNPVQLLTYMFVHDQRTFFHVFFNMFTLFFFGPMLERLWGSKKFFIYYMICGIGAALVQEGVWALTWENEYLKALAVQNGESIVVMRQEVERLIASGDKAILQYIDSFQSASMVTVGASGAIFGVLLGFAFVFPNVPLYLFFVPIPIKAKYMVAGYAVIEFFFGVTHTMNTVAHFAHLGGMLFGLFLLLYWRQKGKLHGNRF